MTQTNRREDETPHQGADSGDSPLPAQGSVWAHSNGNRYTVLMIANLDSQDEVRYPKTVVYQGENGKVWSRAASDWGRSMTPAPTAQGVRKDEPVDSLGIPLSCGKPLCAPGAHHPLCRLARSEEARGEHAATPGVGWLDKAMDLANEYGRDRRCPTARGGSQPQDEATAVAPSGWRELLRQSENNFLRQFGPSAAAAWIYRDLEELLGDSPASREEECR